MSHVFPRNGNFTHAINNIFQNWNPLLIQQMIINGHSYIKTIRFRRKFENDKKAASWRWEYSSLMLKWWHIFSMLSDDLSAKLWATGTCHCPAYRTYLIATRFWVVVICPIIKCLTVLEFSFILFDLCLFITIFNFILNYVPIVTFWIFTYHKIWILLIIFCFIWNYWIVYFLTCLEVFWSVMS